MSTTFYALRVHDLFRRRPATARHGTPIPRARQSLFPPLYSHLNPHSRHLLKSTHRLQSPWTLFPCCCLACLVLQHRHPPPLHSCLLTHGEYPPESHRCLQSRLLLHPLVVVAVLSAFAIRSLRLFIPASTLPASTFQSPTAVHKAPRSLCLNPRGEHLLEPHRHLLSDYFGKIPSMSAPDA